MPHWPHTCLGIHGFDWDEPPGDHPPGDHEPELPPEPPPELPGHPPPLHVTRPFVAVASVCVHPPPLQLIDPALALLWSHEPKLHPMSMPAAVFV